MTVKDGQPEIAVPKTDPPTTLQVQPLIKGKGKKVGENDQITFNYRWVRWSDGKLLEESYSTEPATAALSGLLPGMVKGLTGQPVGSRVLLVIPPADGYPDGNATLLGRAGRDAGDGGRPAVHPVAAVARRRRARLARVEQRGRVPAGRGGGEKVAGVVAPAAVPCWTAGWVSGPGRPVDR